MGITLGTSPAFAKGPPDGPSLTPSEASMVGGSFIVALPFSLVIMGSQEVTRSIGDHLRSHKHWTVAGVREQGEKTAVELRSDDGELKLDLTVVTRTARAEGLKVRDQLDVDPIGKSGFVVKKGAATIGVLTRPGAGLADSKVRT